MNNAGQPSVYPHGDKSLPGVLVTRAAERARVLVETLNTNGFRAVELPSITIKELPVDTRAFSELSVDAVIFTSQHAVDSMHKARAFPWTDYTGGLFAIGPATANRLATLKQSLTRQPVHPFNSEALLSLEEFKNGKHRIVAIVKGKGGRDYLQQELSKRGVELHNIESYERVLPQYPGAKLDTVFTPDAVDVISVTSNEVLKNLLLIAGTRHTNFLLGLPVIVGSQRAANLAGELGFSNDIIVAGSPGDADMLSALQSWRQS